MSTLDSITEPFPTPFVLNVRFVDVPLRVLASDADICARLSRYYAPWVAEEDQAPLGTIRLIQAAIPPGDGFRVIERGDGKATKEAVRDVAGGRLILKLRTGMLIGMGATQAFAIGDVKAHLSQAINLINNCYARIILKGGYVLLHASAVSWNGVTVALAGLSGAGKSTAALHLVDQGFRFVSNDRLLARPLGERVEVLGYPKQPRVNPGTLLNHRRLANLLGPERRAELSAMASADLWGLENKLDVDLEQIYGDGTVELRGTLAVLLLLKWKLSGEAFSLRRLDPTSALANVPILRRDLGAFDLEAKSRARAVQELLKFAEVLGRIAVVEVTGKTDFGALVDAARDLVRRR